MSESNPFLAKMLERLYASLVSGPNINCRPHSSRQRLDFTMFSLLQDLTPGEIFTTLLGAKRQVKVIGKGKFSNPEENHKEKDNQTKSNSSETENGFTQQQAFLNKLQIIKEDAKMYTQDTGTHVLYLGYPILSLPPPITEAHLGMNKRILAPIAFIPIRLELTQGIKPSVLLQCHGEGADVVIPNLSLLTFLQQQTKVPLPDLFMDEEGTDPYREIRELTEYICKALQLEKPNFLAAFPFLSSNDVSPISDASQAKENHKENPSSFLLHSIPKVLSQSFGKTSDFSSKKQDNHSAISIEKETTSGQDNGKEENQAKPNESQFVGEILCSAVLGIFPSSNQNLIKDMQFLAKAEKLPPLVSAFVQAGESLGLPSPSKETEIKTESVANQKTADSAVEPRETLADFRFKTETLMSSLLVEADPFQERAIFLAQKSQGLVIHGPPGTGKSQTILGIIGDHISRGERVLLVCEKRTALDVVAHRLDGLGLTDLYALVHDPERDRTQFYKKLREQLDLLPELALANQAEERYQKYKDEFSSLSGELAQYATFLHQPLPEQGASFHELMGIWQQVQRELIESQEKSTQNRLDKKQLRLTYKEFLKQEHQLQEIFQRAEECNWIQNQWKGTQDLSLATFLKHPLSFYQQKMTLLVAKALQVDQANRADFINQSGAFLTKTSWLKQGEARFLLADKIKSVFDKTDRNSLDLFSNKTVKTIKTEEKFTERYQQLLELTSLVQKIKESPLDVELLESLPKDFFSKHHLDDYIAKLKAYLAISTNWYQFFCFRKKSQAKQILQLLLLPFNPENAKRVYQLLLGIQTRLLLKQGYERVLALSPKDLSHFSFVTPVSNVQNNQGLSQVVVDPDFYVPADSILVRVFDDYLMLFDLFCYLQDTPELGPVQNKVQQVLENIESNPQFMGTLIESLEQAKPFAEAVDALQTVLKDTPLFSADWLFQLEEQVAQGQLIGPIFLDLEKQFPFLEKVILLKEQLLSLPAPLYQETSTILSFVSHPISIGFLLLHEQVLQAILNEHLTNHQALLAWDHTHVNRKLQRLIEVQELKRLALCELTLNKWKQKQKDRLLASTGTRLNGLATEVRRRLSLRGEKALRLRQVIYSGQEIPEGDPLFDLCPIWMASPETVAQIFPTTPCFDTVIFDEASQCRLEEALPVLMRAKRVVIAGDPKQLPPTRFFEAAFSLETEEAETEQGLFEQQQANTEDLLAAALNLEIEECHLQVHYRSKNEELISFSNQHFYQSQLQYLPSQPFVEPVPPAISLIRAEGIYEKRGNVKEAQKVCELVQELLLQEQPPSIGIACFNVTQRDLILTTLAEKAASDVIFAARFEEARNRQGAGSFEGLFVKNLENVQGDERDHLIISTTYGPDEKGRFYRRFGPLGQSQGARRLNVLITRAKEAISIITSIPEQAYQVLPPIPKESQPSGVYLLFAYLQYAQSLSQGTAQKIDALGNADFFIQPTHSTSLFVTELAKKVKTSSPHPMFGHVFWGSKGLCVDMALPSLDKKQKDWFAVLCDFHRFEKAPDVILWEAFRTRVLQKKGWNVFHLWTPHLYRHQEEQLQQLFLKLGNKTKDD